MAADNHSIRITEKSPRSLGAVSGELTGADSAWSVGAVSLLCRALLLTIFLTALVGSYLATDAPQIHISALAVDGQSDAESKTDFVTPLLTISFCPCLERAVAFAPEIAGARATASPDRAKVLLLRGPPAA